MVFLNPKLGFVSGVTSNTNVARVTETFGVAECPQKVGFSLLSVSLSLEVFSDCNVCQD